jgi:hypothetical protein
MRLMGSHHANRTKYSCNVLPTIQMYDLNSLQFTPLAHAPAIEHRTSAFPLHTVHQVLQSTFVLYRNSVLLPPRSFP